MQGIYRQFWHQTAKIQNKTKQTCFYFYSLRYNNKNNDARQKNLVKQFIQIRRPKSRSPFNQHTEKVKGLRRSEEIQKLEDCEQKIKKIKCMRRYTYYVTQTTEQKVKGKKLNDFVLPSARQKSRKISQQTMYSHGFNKSKFTWKFKEKMSKIQEQTQNKLKQKQQSKTFKKIKKLNETAFEENIFVDLIKRFRFQNLKTGVFDQNLGSPFSKTKLKRQRSLSGLNISENKARYKQQQAFRSTCHHKSMKKQTKKEKKLLNLTPWQIADDIEFLS